MRPATPNGTTVRRTLLASGTASCRTRPQRDHEEDDMSAATNGPYKKGDAPAPPRQNPFHTYDPATRRICMNRTAARAVVHAA